MYQQARYSGTMEVIPYDAQGNFHYHNLASFGEVLYRLIVAKRPVFGDAVLQMMWQLMLDVARLHSPAGTAEAPEAPSAPPGIPKGLVPPDDPDIPGRNRPGGPSGFVEGSASRRHSEAPSGSLGTLHERPPSGSSESLQAQSPLSPADAPEAAPSVGPLGDPAAQGSLDRPKAQAASKSERIHEDV